MLMPCSETPTNSFCFPFRKIDSMYRKQSSTIIKFFKTFYPRLEKNYLIKSNSKSLSN